MFKVNIKVSFVLEIIWAECLKNLTNSTRLS